MKWVAVIVCLIGAVLAAVGGFIAFDQHRKIVTFAPVAATVVLSSVEMHRGSKGGSSYSPVVEYRYQVAGAQYTSRKVLPVSVSASQSWAKSVVAGYPAGKQTEAYYNPGAPGESFLVRQHSMFPHVFLTIGLALLGGGLLLSVCRERPAPEPEPTGRGWYRFSTQFTVGARARMWLTAGVGWEVITMIGLGSYVVVAERPLGLSDIVAGGVAAGLGAIPMGIAAYYLLMSGSFADAAVELDRARLLVGQGANVRVEQSVYKSMRIEELAVGLICRKTTRTQRGGKTRYSTETDQEKWWPVVMDRQVLGGEAIGGEASIEAPAGGQPTTIDAGKNKEYPRFEWHLSVRTRVGGRPDYRGSFEVVVEGN